MTAVAASEESYRPSDLRVELLRDAKGIYGIGTVGTLKNPGRRAVASLIVSSPLTKSVVADSLCL